MNLSQAQLAFSLPWREGPQQAHEDDGQIKAPVEQILHLRQVKMPIFCEVKRVVRPTDGRLEVTQHRVDRLELRQLNAEHTTTGNRSFMGMSDAPAINTIFE